MEFKKIISIGDCHGRQYWKNALFGGISQFDQWAVEVFEGIGDFMSDQYPFSKYDKVVFIGDYVDSFNIRNIDIKKNLEDIILFKKTFPNKVVLLLGNHDLQYRNGEKYVCSGYRPEAKYDLGELLNTKVNGVDLFQAAYKYKNWLWTHAGITLGFKIDCIDTVLKKKANNMYADLFDEDMDIDEFINTMYGIEHPYVFRVSHARGGSSNVPGPFWADRRELLDKPMYDLNQIVGHTPATDISGYHFNAGRYEGKDQKIYFIDCLGNDIRNYLVLEENDKGIMNPKVVKESEV